VNLQANLGGNFTLPGGDLSLRRMGYGAMQLAGPGVWGPPHDVATALEVLREAITLGINHIDTSDYYGPHITNQLIRRALAPYPDDLVIVTKIGGRRGADGAWLPAFSPHALTTAVHDNLRNLGQDKLQAVNLRMFGPGQAIEEPLLTLVDLQRQGLIHHIGLSNVTRAQIMRGAAVAKIVCVQNFYNLAHRDDDALIDELADKGIAYMPYLPLSGVTPLQSPALSNAAVKLGVAPVQVALAWLLQRSPNILLIPGTSSVEHLRENVKAATLTLPEEVFAAL
jgi:aryl-alcohol dehydrogenase-like predicted oxidoreductase